MTSALFPTAVYLDRLARVRSAMEADGVDVLLLSVGPDLPYLTGYEAMPLERLTMLVVPRDRDATLVVPRLEAPRVAAQPGLFTLSPWNETDDPIAIVAGLVGGSATAATTAIGDHTWSRFLVDLMGALPKAVWRRAVHTVGPIRMRKDAAEIEALAAAGAAVDRIAAQLQGGEIRLVGRTEADVSAEISTRIRAEGHDKVNFAIVAAGENAASPHHEAGSRVIRSGEVVLTDFGGTKAGYCSDITRCVSIGEPSAEIADAYAALHRAQQAGVAAGVVGVPCEQVDLVTRQVLVEAGYGDFFIHRTGHGIGMEAHEDPYMVQGNTQRLEAGHAYSVEPGIYVPGRFGMRLEDIVVATADGPRSLNNAARELVVVDG
jgi:Xaa-Pro aminopeptidase